MIAVAPKPSPADSATPASKPPRAKWTWRSWLKLLTALNATAVLLLFLLVCVVSERWWVSAAISYLPRLPFAVPSLALFVATVFVIPRWGAANALGAIVCLVIVAGLCAPVERDPIPSDSSRVLTVLSCNVQDCRSSPERILWEFKQVDPDVLILQEAPECEPLIERYSDWHIVEHGEYMLISRFPARLLEEVRTSQDVPDWRRQSAIVFEVDAPQGTFQVVNVHCHTARFGLDELSWHSIATGYGVDEFRMHQEKRAAEMEELAEFCEETSERMPTIIAGDFNTPSSSNLFTGNWSDYCNAFESTGWGYGYTAPCNTNSRWPSNTPWLRIDHILVDDDWKVHSCGIGHTNGSDHRLIWAQVSL